MDTSYDKVISYLTEEQGFSLNEAKEIMVLCVEQGMNPTEIFSRGLADMLGLTKDKKKVTTSTPPKVKTPRQTGGLVGTRNVPTMKDLGAAPKPEFGPGSTKSGKSFPKPPKVTRDAGAAVRQRFMSRPSAPATVSKGVGLVKGAKSLAKGPLAVGADIAADATLTPVAKAAGTELGKALTRGVASATGTTDKMKSRLPSYYGAAGPDLTRDIVKGVQQRSKLDQQKAETQAASQPKPQQTGERSVAASTEKQERAKAESQRRREAVAPKPAPKPPTAQERAYGARSKLTADQQAMNREYDRLRGLENGRVTKPKSKALDQFLAKRKLK